MKKLLTFLFVIGSFTAYSQGITVTVGDKVGKAYNSDSLGGKVPAFYVDTLNNQNISGTKTFKGNIIIGKDILPDSTEKRSFGSQTFRVKKLWLGNGIDMGGRLISLDSIDKGINFDSRVHIKSQNDTSGSLCFHPSKYMPLVNSESGYRLWADSTTNKPKWLLPNSDTSIKINYIFVMEDTSGNVKITGDVSSSSITVNGVTADSMITLDQATGNLANLTTTFDTLFSGVFQSNISVSSIKDSLVTKCECSDVVDDGTITLPDATTQSLVVWVDGDNEWAQCAIQDDGTVTKLASVGSVVITDTDANLVINALGAGTLVSIKNRLGSTKTICYETKYKQ